MNNNKIERAAIRAVEDYIDKCPRFDSYISSNDKTPIWDGDIFIYSGEDSHSVRNFQYRIPLQVKGTTKSGDDCYRIEREYLEGFKSDRGCVFFLVQEDQGNNRVLYSILTLRDLEVLLKGTSETISIRLNNIQDDHALFEQEIIEFARARSKGIIENTIPKEVFSLVNDFKLLKEHLAIIEDTSDQYDIESLINSIESLKTDGTVGWRDKFIYYSNKALQLIDNIRFEHDYSTLMFRFGVYLLNQGIYHLSEEYLVRSLALNQTNDKTLNNQSRIIHANILSNLGYLHSCLDRNGEAEEELLKAVDEMKTLHKLDKDVLGQQLASTLNNLALLRSRQNRFLDSEKGFKEALTYITDNTENVISDSYKNLSLIATILNNLANLYNKYNQPDTAESKYREALNIYNRLLQKSSDYMSDKAMILNNLASLHDVNKNYCDAEKEYKEAFDIYQELAKHNPDVYLSSLATTLNNIAILHKTTFSFKESEAEFKEALCILKKLSNKYPDAYLNHVADTLNNLANLHSSIHEWNKSGIEYTEALNIYRKLAKTNANIYNCYILGSLCNLVLLHTVENRDSGVDDEIQEILVLYWSAPEMIPDSFLSRMLNALHDTSIVYYNQKKFDRAENVFQEIMKICRTLIKINPGQYSEHGINTLCNLASIHLANTKVQRAEDEMNEALSIWMAFNSIPENLQLFMVSILRDLFLLHMKIDDIIEAEKNLNAILNIYYSLHEKKPSAYDDHIGYTYLLLALSQNQSNRNNEAKISCEKAIEIFKSILVKKESELINQYLQKAQELLVDICKILS